MFLKLSKQVAREREKTVKCYVYVVYLVGIHDVKLFCS